MGRGTARRAGAKLAFIEGMRGLAALYVVLGHICSIAIPGVYLGQRSDAPEWLRLLAQPFGHGHLAVAAFIVISGFCLQTSLFNGGNGTITDLRLFYKRRALRILPPYYACLALSLLVVFYITPLGGDKLPFSQYVPVDTSTIISHVFLFQNWSPDWMYKINGVLWSIAIEAQLYILFPLIVFLLNKAYRLPTLLLATGVSASVLLLWPKAEKFYPWYFALFTLGMAASHLAYDPPKWRGPNALASMIFGGFALVGCIYCAMNGYSMPVLDAWMGACVVSVMYACTVSKKFTVGKWLSIRALQWLGAISYSLYLMHHMFLQPLYVFRPTWAHEPLQAMLFLTVVGIPAIFIGVCIFWLLFERPFMRRPKRKVSEPTPALQPSQPRAVITTVAPKERVPVSSSKRGTVR